MRQLIEAKLKEYQEKFPNNSEFKTWYTKSNLWAWTHAAFKLKGQNVSKPYIVDLLEGTLREDVPLSSYSFVMAFKDIYMDMQEELSMQSNPSLKLYLRWAEMLGLGEIRKSNPVVFDFGLIPCHFNSIKDELDGAFKRFYSAKVEPIEATCILFLDLIKIYPYIDASIDMAMITMMYCLLGLGYPIPQLNITYEDFKKLLAPYMCERPQHAEFYEMFQKSMLERLESIIALEDKVLEQEQ